MTARQEVTRQEVTRRLRDLAIGLRDLLLPLVCVSCHRCLDAGEQGVVCGRCWARLKVLPHPRCGRCGHPTSARACRWCELLPPFVRAARSVCWVRGDGPEGGTGAAVVHALKYGGWPRVADAMAERMSRESWPADVTAERTALVPVPLASIRQRERGYNQSALLARGLAVRWHVPVWDDVLERARATVTQTRLTPGERRSNVSGAFEACPRDDRLSGAHLMLVDDVVTTAATMNACASALFGAGARIVSYITFGRAPAAYDRT